MNGLSVNKNKGYSIIIVPVWCREEILLAVDHYIFSTNSRLSFAKKNSNNYAAVQCEEFLL